MATCSPPRRWTWPATTRPATITTPEFSRFAGFKAGRTALEERSAMNARTPNPRLTRRTLLMYASGLAGVSLLSACGSSTGGTTAGATSAGSTAVLTSSTTAPTAAAGTTTAAATTSAAAATTAAATTSAAGTKAAATTAAVTRKAGELLIT